MKIIFCLLSFVCAMQLSAIEQVELSKITYGWLKKNDAANSGEYLPYYREIFAELKDKNMLQLGVGYLTKYFLDHCKKVVSIEVITDGYGPDRFKEYMTLYKSCSHWVPIAYFSAYHGDTQWTFFKYFGSDVVYNANNYQIGMAKSYLSVDPMYLKEMDSFFKNLVKLNKFECVHVNPDSLYIRGDIVQTLFGKVPIIVAGDAGARIRQEYDVYGYSSIVTPEDYEEIQSPERAVIWILKDPKYADLIDRLQNM